MESPKKYADITEAERIRRIAALVATAVVRYHRIRKSGAPTPEGPAVVSTRPVATEQLVSEPTEQRMISYLRRTGSATPRDFQIALGLSPMTVTRRLARLRSAGLLAVEGHTRSACYTLRTDFDQN